MRGGRKRDKEKDKKREKDKGEGVFKREDFWDFLHFFKRKQTKIIKINLEKILSTKKLCFSQKLPQIPILISFFDF